MRVTYALIALNLAVYGFMNFSASSSSLESMLGLNIGFFTLEWPLLLQPLTSMFMHGSPSHIAMNMVVLFQFGSVLERYLGSLRFFLVYMIGGVLTSLFSLSYIYYAYVSDGSFVNLVGASGAICVLLGVLAFLDKSSRLGLVIAILLMSFVPLAFGVNIAWYAHIIGFILGFLYAKIAFKRAVV